MDLQGELDRIVSISERIRATNNIPQLLRWKVLHVIAPWYCRRRFKELFAQWSAAYLDKDWEGQIAAFQRMSELQGGANTRKRRILA